MHGDPLDKCHKLVWRNRGVKVSRTPGICIAPTIEGNSETRDPPMASETREPLSSGGALKTREPLSSRWHQGAPNGLGNPEAPKASETRETLSLGGALETREPLSLRSHHTRHRIAIIAPQGAGSPATQGEPLHRDGHTRQNPRSFKTQLPLKLHERGQGKRAACGQPQPDNAPKDWSASVATRSGPASTVAEV